jgi:hypothetical protein
MLCYIKGTYQFGIEYTKGGSSSLVDLDWAGDVDDRKSTSGYTFNLDLGPFTWFIKK